MRNKVGTAWMKMGFMAMLLIFSNMAGAVEPSKIKWYINYDEAFKEAKKQNIPILLFFHGSDWCPPCIRMQKEVFSSEKFTKSTSDKVVFLDVDFPVKNKLSDKQLEHNQKLKAKFGLPQEFSQGYPQVVIVDLNGKVLYQEKGYSGEGIEKLISVIRSLK